jgi:hypothetical protein
MTDAVRPKGNQGLVNERCLRQVTGARIRLALEHSGYKSIYRLAPKGGTDNLSRQAEAEKKKDEGER